ncbi:MAG TPA: diaminopimelate decarboxylase [Candidatus Eisenbacteria bacterium]
MIDSAPGPAGLSVSGVPLADLASRFGTPLYVYSADTLLERYRELDRAFAAIPHRLHYSVKANASRALLSLLAREGAGADVVSEGEMERALRAGFAPGHIVFAGAGKTDAELARALGAKIGLINIESAGEMARLTRLAGDRRVSVAFRVTPDIVGGTHHYTETGTRATKFGIPEETALELAGQLAARRGAGPTLVGLHVHFGSQITRLEPFVAAAEKLAALVRAFRAKGADIEHVNMGGGLGIRYKDEEPPTPAALAGAVVPVYAGLEIELLLEPGRWIVGPSGLLLATVIDVKTTGTDTFVVVDAGMNDLIRPSLYGAWHDIAPVVPRPGTARVVDVVGPICETGDFLARGRELPPLEPGDVVAVRDAGAYGFSMASTYNSRPRPAEVLVDSGRTRIIRRRETIDDLLVAESD